MKNRYILFRQSGVFYGEDTVTGKQSSLRTRNEAEAHSVLNAKNEALRQPVLNLQIARAYLSASDPAFSQRTWLNWHLANDFHISGEFKVKFCIIRPRARRHPTATRRIQRGRFVAGMSRRQPRHDQPFVRPET